jgi:hypothetical protein
VFLRLHRQFVIGNPPWSKMRAFLIHAMTISDNVVFLASMPHFVTTARMRDIAAANFAPREALIVPNPPAWPQSGFALTAYHLQRGWTGGLTTVHLSNCGSIPPSRDTDQPPHRRAQ